MKNEFDLKAASWDEDPAKLERARAISCAIVARIPLSSKTRVLEYGCGTGLLSFELQPLVGKIVPADSSDGMLSVLKSKIESSGATNMVPLKLDLERDSLPGDRFDLICSMMTLHHVSDLDKIFRSFASLLDPGGYLAIADLDLEDGSFHGAGFTGHKGFDRSALEEIAARNGFSAIDFETVHRINREETSGTRTYPVFLLTARVL